MGRAEDTALAELDPEGRENLGPFQAWEEHQVDDESGAVRAGTGGMNRG